MPLPVETITIQRDQLDNDGAWVDARDEAYSRQIEPLLKLKSLILSETKMVIDQDGDEWFEFIFTANYGEF